jgi:hypothetical protein
MDLQKCLEDIGELAAGARVICDIYNQISRSIHKADFMVEKLVLQTSSLYGNQNIQFYPSATNACSPRVEISFKHSRQM